jgi:hypothetical protein
MLLATMTFFYLPHTVYYFVSFNEGTADPIHPAVVFYMTLMPYIKMISDPIVYGVRMRRHRRGPNNDTRRGPGFSLVGHGTNPAVTTAIGASTTAAAAVVMDEFVGRRRSAPPGGRRQAVYVCCCLPMCGRFVLTFGATFAASCAAEDTRTAAIPETTSLTTTTSTAVASLASGRHRWTHGVDVMNAGSTCGYGRVWSATRRNRRSVTGSGDYAAAAAGTSYGLIRLETLSTNKSTSNPPTQEQEFL